MSPVRSSGRRWLPDPQVCKRYGVSAMTLWRWDRNPEMNFPGPIRINGRKYRDEDALEAWDRARAMRPQDDDYPQRAAALGPEAA
jgi:predicted DNA-binding transcriptional regulator AlpA